MLTASQQSAALAIGFRHSCTGYGELEFAGIAPSGNVMARKPGDKLKGFGTFCLRQPAASQMIDAIARAYPRRTTKETN